MIDIIAIATSTENKFQTGDVVVCESHGYTMTVTGIKGNDIKCSWLETDELHYAIFAPEELTRVKPRRISEVQ